MTKTDRRVQRSRELLQKALIELIREQGYDAIGIQDIVDRANLGRTTFYQHYTSKDDLFISCHEAVVGEFLFEPLYPLARDALLAPEAPIGMLMAYRHLNESRHLLVSIFQGKDSALILRRIRDWNAEKIEMSLRNAFSEADSRIPFDMLATYLAGAQLNLMHWWLEKRQLHTADILAQSIHRLQRAAIRDALGLSDE